MKIVEYIKDFEVTQHYFINNKKEKHGLLETFDKFGNKFCQVIFKNGSFYGIYIIKVDNNIKIMNTYKISFLHGVDITMK